LAEERRFGMGPVRAIGLLFFMTILVGGCILANSSPQQPETAEQVVAEIPLDTAISYLKSGEVLSLTRGDLVLVLDLKDGSKVSVSIPSEEVLREVRTECGTQCEAFNGLSL
jgi:hypothetical protein